MIFTIMIFTVKSRPHYLEVHKNKSTNAFRPQKWSQLIIFAEYIFRESIDPLKQFGKQSAMKVKKDLQFVRNLQTMKRLENFFVTENIRMVHK